MPADPYVKCPEYDTESFRLRLVEIGDAENLLKCYSDSAAVELMNADFCTSDFHYETIQEMRECIRFWLEEYERGAYARLSVIDKRTCEAVGTVEFFGGACGVLRVDLQAGYEKKADISELLCLAGGRLREDFRADRIIMKAIPKAAERLTALKEHGYKPDVTFRPGLDYYVS
jgi:ribosomal-protein-alanine N-acetyltransferase